MGPNYEGWRGGAMGFEGPGRHVDQATSFGVLYERRCLIGQGTGSLQ